MATHALNLVVTPELTVPTELLKTKPLDRLIEERILGSHREEQREEHRQSP